MASRSNHNLRANCCPFNVRSNVPTIGSLLLVASACVYIALRLLSLWTPRISGDEVFSYSTTVESWLQLAKLVAGDLTHPPLFYVLLKSWTYLVDDSIFDLRVLTFAVSIVSIIPVISLGRQLEFQTREIALALFLMAMNNYLVIYSYVLRNYCLVLFLSLCSILVFVRFLRNKFGGTKDILIVAAVNVLFVYVHYFAWLLIAAQYIWVVLTDSRSLRRFTTAIVIVVLCFIPWVVVVVYASRRVTLTIWDHFSVEGGVRLESLVELLRSFNGGFVSTELTLAGSVGFLLLIISVPMHAIHRSSRNQVCLNSLALLAWITCFCVVVSAIVAATFTWMWAPRLLIIVIGPYYLLIAGLAFRLTSAWSRAAAVMFLVGWSTVSGLAPIVGLTNDLADVLVGPNAPPYWLAVELSRAETQANGPVRVYTLTPNATAGLELALSITGEKRFEIIKSHSDTLPLDEYFWVVFTEIHPTAVARVTKLFENIEYSFGASIYSGVPGERYIATPIHRRNVK
jgi:uncharacterized membrane protein